SRPRPAGRRARPAARRAGAPRTVRVQPADAESVPRLTGRNISAARGHRRRRPGTYAGPRPARRSPVARPVSGGSPVPDDRQAGPTRATADVTPAGSYHRSVGAGPTAGERLPRRLLAGRRSWADDTG